MSSLVPHANYRTEFCWNGRHLISKTNFILVSISLLRHWNVMHWSGSTWTRLLLSKTNNLWYSMLWCFISVQNWVSKSHILLLDLFTFSHSATKSSYLPLAYKRAFNISLAAYRLKSRLARLICCVSSPSSHNNNKP